MQFNGVGVERDRTAAVELLRRAALKGNAVAQNRLAHLYAEGLGVDVDLSAAKEWRDKAKAAGLNDPSLDFLSNASTTPKPAEQKPAEAPAAK
jgi:TPR repeat protein